MDPIGQIVIDELWEHYKIFTKNHLGTSNVSANLSASFFLAWLQKNLDRKEYV